MGDIRWKRTDLGDLVSADKRFEVRKHSQSFYGTEYISFRLYDRGQHVGGPGLKQREAKAFAQSIVDKEQES